MQSQPQTGKPRDAEGARPPITRKVLLDWAGPLVFRDAETLFEKGLVEDATYDHPIIEGCIRWANRSLKAKLEILDNGTVENLCPCRDSVERGIICTHVIALGLSLVDRQTDPMREKKYREERRRAERFEQFETSDYIQRAGAGHEDAIPATLKLTLEQDWQGTSQDGGATVHCSAQFYSYELGLEDMPRDQVFKLSKADDAMLHVLEDISEGPARNNVRVSSADFINLLQLMPGREIHHIDGESIEIHDMDVPSVLRMDLDRENGELILVHHTELPFQNAGEFPLYIVDGKKGWVYGAGHFWPLESLLPAPLHAIYANPVVIPRDGVFRFLSDELPRLQEHITIQTDITPDLFTIAPATPSFRLVVKGSPASIAPELYAEYEGHALVAGKDDASGAFSIPDPNDLMRYTVRNPRAERVAFEVLAGAGLHGTHGLDLAPIVGCREVLNFLGGRLPGLRRLGWKVDLHGKVEPLMDSTDFVTPVVHVRTSSGANWFEVDFDFDSGSDCSLSEADIQQAMLKGDSYVERSGRTILFDSDAMEELRDVFADLSGGDGGDARMRIDNLHAAFIKSSLDALDGVDVEAEPEWRDRARHLNRDIHPDPVTLEPKLRDTLRPYQAEGVDWLRFLEHNRFGGILADEMGLGKTIQTLAWLSLERLDHKVQKAPALVVCPTSLVYNWLEEAERFVPHLDVLIMSGAERNDRWEDVPNADLVVTSYALMRRDVDHYLETEFSAVILDEAQHIKNRSTQNAVAAKQLRAQHRFVLTGTPIENSVADLWSIMDFLMPGYLGRYDMFRGNYELPIGRGEGPGETAQVKLRRKLNPFLMRRLKSDVAKDLPPKIERVISCPLTSDQKLVYKKYVESSRRKITDMVASKGFDKSRMEILKLLLRLRQICCHLELLKLTELDKSKQPSAKLDIFFELLNEAMDSGHRILVFSQFTSMLAILRREIEAQGHRYCYLDGSTKNRIEVVREFNTDRDIPLFLISLKAGGTGLNLTGADMVIHFDPWWNPAVEDQATDRAHRIGQQKTVYSIKLITKDTVEEKVLAMQKAKRSVIDATIESDGDAGSALSWEDVQDILTL
ncbi:MAG: SNF2-related protein [Verrucomicrobia bacterium]|nr:SNF2-related protein [Verrucomicrobiota bacterium]